VPSVSRIKCRRQPVYRPRQPALATMRRTAWRVEGGAKGGAGAGAGAGGRTAPTPAPGMAVAAVAEEGVEEERDEG
jgi:hypothetical protein